MDLSSLYDDSSIIDALKYNEGPLLINAGPGSGKTQFLTTKAAYLILKENIKEEEIILCTFTEKAAIELKNRIKFLLNKIDPIKASLINIDKIRAGTIHSIFLNIIEDNIHYTNLSSGFSVLNELDRKLFIFNNLDKFNFESYKIPTSSGKTKLFYHFNGVSIFSQEVDGWLLTDYLCKFYDNIVDQGVEIYGCEEFLNKIEDPSQKKIFESYSIYKQLLHEENLLDFSQIQNEYWHLLLNTDARIKIRKQIKYILVDEYQDTNYIQERALLETIGNVDIGDTEITNFEKNEKYKSKNITVVGDFNQSLYRFRGANIDNILTFDTKFLCEVKILKLLKNYRSTKSIISLCNSYINSNLNFYKDTINIDPKEFQIIPGKEKNDFQIVTFKSDGAKTIYFVLKIKALIDAMIASEKITNLSDVAVLLPSIRYTEANCFIDAFGDEIKLSEEFDFFNNDLTISILTTLAQLFDIKSIDESRISYEFKLYFDKNILNKTVFTKDELSTIHSYFYNNSDLVNLLYYLLSHPKLKIFIQESYYHYIGKLSFLLNKFSSYTKTNDFNLFFEEYLPFIFNNAEEIFDTELELSSDKINLLTIHQSKGLQFPIVIVGYNKTISNFRNVPLYKDPRTFITSIINRKEIEGESIVEEMQLKRLFYVAFSRAKDLLIIGSRTNKINELLDLKKVTYNHNNNDYSSIIPSSFSYIPEKSEKTKPVFSYTGDILTYNLCPQMYAFLNEYGLETLDTTDFSFGKFVHQTIENINNKIVEEQHVLSFQELKDLANIIFELNFNKTLNSEKFKDQKSLALFQVMNYVSNFRALLNPSCIVSTEEVFVWEENEFILKGKIDVIFKTNNQVIIVDVKSGRKEKRTEKDIKNFENQVKLYGNYYFNKYHVIPKLMIYSTGEHNFRDGEYYVPCIDFSEVTEKLREIILRIIAKDFSLNYKDLNLSLVCSDCPFNSFCMHKIIP